MTVEQNMSFDYNPFEMGNKNVFKYQFINSNGKNMINI